MPIYLKYSIAWSIMNMFFTWNFILRNISKWTVPYWKTAHSFIHVFRFKTCLSWPDSGIISRCWYPILYISNLELQSYKWNTYTVNIKRKKIYEVKKFQLLEHKEPSVSLNSSQLAAKADWIEGIRKWVQWGIPG